MLNLEDYKGGLTENMNWEKNAQHSGSSDLYPKVEPDITTI